MTVEEFERRYGYASHEPERMPFTRSLDELDITSRERVDRRNYSLLARTYVRKYKGVLVPYDDFCKFFDCYPHQRNSINQKVKIQFAKLGYTNVSRKKHRSYELVEKR